MSGFACRMSVANIFEVCGVVPQGFGLRHKPKPSLGLNSQSVYGRRDEANQIEPTSQTPILKPGVYTKLETPNQKPNPTSSSSSSSSLPAIATLLLRCCAAAALLLLATPPQFLLLPQQQLPPAVPDSLGGESDCDGDDDEADDDDDDGDPHGEGDDSGAEGDGEK